MEQQEQSITRSSEKTKETENSLSLVREPVENTPFWIIGNDELGYKLTWGKYNISEKHKTQEELQEWTDTHPWEITLRIIAVAFAVNDEINALKNKELLGKPEFRLKKGGN